jgi:hypothetical protein
MSNRPDQFTSGFLGVPEPYLFEIPTDKNPWAYYAKTFTRTANRYTITVLKYY